MPATTTEDQPETTAAAAFQNAKRCFDEDESFLKRGEIAEYLGAPKPFNRLVLKHYMDHFDFAGKRLDMAFRVLCQKLVLKGETQEVDRILEVFAERYVTCNPRSLLGGADHSKDVVHAITYSILLLNTDLHIVQQSSKMSKSAFIKNTLQAVQSHLTSLQSYSTSIPTSAEDCQKKQALAQFQKDQLHQQHIQTRYRMEGILWRKHLLERTDKKAQHRAWRQLLVVVDPDHGTLSMFRSDGSLPKAQPSTYHQPHGSTSSLPTSSSLPLGDRDADMPLFDEIPLQHTITNILPPPGYSSSRRHVFAVQLHTGAVYLFQTTSPQECEAWARTCNYWAARTSKEPLLGGVVNMEYGWGLHGSLGDSISLFEWTAPMPTMTASKLTEEDQMLALRKYVASLESDMEVHQDHRLPMTRLFMPKTSNHTKAFNNWERRSRYLLKEMVKYQIYVECLEQSLQVQKLQDMQHENHERGGGLLRTELRTEDDLEAELAKLIVHEGPHA
ncbi:MAG: hypothetical protein J3Q66DRAFT_278880 [Benniella sp.]|nr:MAG: hypothetical protein J3Q66DRAFT_278880 [Benniella sp.]